MFSRPLIRYTLLQVPGWLLLGLLLWWAVSREWMGMLAATGIMAAWLIKDALLYPVCKHAFENSHPVESMKLVGLEAETVSNLSPEGLVRVNGELWTARAPDGTTIPAGQRIRIIDAEGLVLYAEALT